MSSFDRIVEMVNEKNTPTYPINGGTVSLDNLVVENASTHNTRVTMRAKTGINSGYRGQVDLFYTRVPLANLGLLGFWREQPYTYEEVLQLINRQKIAKMGPDDFTNDGLPLINNGEVVRFTLSARDDSLAWLGNTQITLLSGVPEKAPELNTFWGQELGALFAPFSDN